MIGSLMYQALDFQWYFAPLDHLLGFLAWLVLNQVTGYSIDQAQVIVYFFIVVKLGFFFSSQFLSVLFED